MNKLAAMLIPARIVDYVTDGEVTIHSALERALNSESRARHRSEFDRVAKENGQINAC